MNITTLQPVWQQDEQHSDDSGKKWQTTMIEPVHEISNNVAFRHV